MIPRFKKGSQVVLRYVIKAKKEENHIEHLYHEALVNLFQDKDTIYILKMRELYRHLSNSADRCDEAANIMRYCDKDSLKLLKSLCREGEAENLLAKI